MVLFPQRTGTFTIDPFVLQLSIVTGQSGFFRRSVAYETESSEPVDILIKPSLRMRRQTLMARLVNFK